MSAGRSIAHGSLAGILAQSGQMAAFQRQADIKAVLDVRFFRERPFDPPKIA
jgi:hypothetical protein